MGEPFTADGGPGGAVFCQGGACYVPAEAETWYARLLALHPHPSRPAPPPPPPEAPPPTFAELLRLRPTPSPPQLALPGFAEAVEDLAPDPAPVRAGEVAIPDGARHGHCRSCGAAVVWATTAGGAAVPLSYATVVWRGGERFALSHFGDCPQAKGWSKR